MDDLGVPAFLGTHPHMEQMMTKHKIQHLQFFHKLGQTWTMTGARQKLNSIFTPTSLELRSSRIWDASAGVSCDMVSLQILADVDPHGGLSENGRSPVTMVTMVVSTLKYLKWSSYSSFGWWLGVTPLQETSIWLHIFLIRSSDSHILESQSFVSFARRLRLVRTEVQGSTSVIGQEKATIFLLHPSGKGEKKERSSRGWKF